MSRILVTGSSGAVARAVLPELVAHGHQVRGLDRVPTAGLAESVVDDIENRDAVQRAMQGMNAVIHLAAEPNDAEFSQLVGPNVLGLFNVMNAAREERVERVVLASSVQVIGRQFRGARPVAVQDSAPSNHYALTKLWAEHMGEMYARCYGMSVLAVRIGWLVRNRDEAITMMQRPLKDLYLSSKDAGRFFLRAVQAPNIGFAVVYAASQEAAQTFDLEPARELLGFIPQDSWPSGLDFEVPTLDT